MKKIGIDARLYSQTGVGVYLRNLLHFIEKFNPSNKDFYIYLIENDYRKINFRRKNFIKRLANFHWHTFGEQTSFLREIYKDNLDLMHFTYFGYPVLYKRPFVATIHDLTPLLLKTGKASTKNKFIYGGKHFIFKNLVLKAQVKNSKYIITPTEWVKSQLGRLYGETVEKKSAAIYEGVNYELFNSKENESMKKKFADFFIYIGNFYPHKNINRLVEAFSKLNIKEKLILVGPDDFFAKQILQLIIKLKCEEKILLYSDPTTEDFIFFYKNAKALIHPSLSEGFGLPPIEAAYFGCPTIASNIPVFQEILGDQYVKFEPKNIEDIKDKIEYFIKNEPEFDLSTLAKKYSFEKMTEETLAVYNQLL